MHHCAVYKLTTSCNQLDLSTVVRMRWQLSPGRWSNRLSQRGQSCIRLDPWEGRQRGLSEDTLINRSTVWLFLENVAWVMFKHRLPILSARKWINWLEKKEKKREKKAALLKKRFGKSIIFNIDQLTANKRPQLQNTGLLTAEVLTGHFFITHYGLTV